MIRKVLKYPFIIIMSIMIVVVFIMYLFMPVNDFSGMENRYLAKRPKVTLQALKDGSYMSGFESYTEDQMPFRDVLIRLKAISEKTLLKNENNGIVEGKDGFLFQKLLKEELILRNEASICKFAEDSDRTINVCIVPNSYEIYGELTPVGFPSIEEKSYIDRLYDKLSRLDNQNTIMLYDSLIKHKDEYIYYRTDHHWTTLGAYYGYSEICRQLDKEPVELNELPDMKEAGGFYGTYYSKYKGVMIEPDTIQYYDIPVAEYVLDGRQHDTLYDEAKLDTYDKYAMFLYGNEGLGKIESANNESGDTLVIFKDSYSNCMIPFLTYNYSTIVIVDLRYYNESVSNLLKEYNDADILLMYNFMHYNEDNHFYRIVS